MSDKGEQKKQEKPIEPKITNAPDIEVTEEEGGTEDKDDRKKSAVGTFTGMFRKRSKSKSPETRKDKTQMGAESSKGDFKLATPPSKKGTAAFIRNLFKVSPKRGQGGEETENLCEQEVVPHANVNLAPPETDQSISISPPPETETETMEDKCDTYDLSSSVSSAPSGYSNLPNDDCDTDITSPDDLDSPDEGERK